MKTSRETLLRSIETVQAALSSREIIEQSTCVVFQDGKVSAFNDEICIRAPSGLDESFKGAVPARPLITLLQKMEEDDVDILPGEGEMIVKGKGRSAGVRMEAEITLPIDAVDPPGKWKPLDGDFLQAVELAQQCASENAAHFERTCIHFAPDWVEATDDKQFLRYTVKTGLKSSVLLRKTSTAPLVTLGVTEFSATERWMHYRSGGDVIISCRKFVEAYPDTNDICKVSGKSVVLPKGLKKAIDKASIFSQENVNGDMLQVELVPGRVRLKGQGANGWYKESRKVSYDGPPLSFFIAPPLLASIVEKHNEVLVAPERLFVQGGKWVYVACLIPPEEETETTEERGEDS